ncbi:MAG TPA: Smr/MutS family protein [Syntrophorhabdaceae bacterium]|nr:Smr/MutS family protein [Syntrophorhabdaceae bacterium]HNT69723.1 Smr/MutS family protein [Syntrophorhabdaceae bacterium]
MADDMEPVEIPVDGVLDLHAFRPGEIKDLIPDYIRLCKEKDIYEIRIIHGKGTGQLRRTVHSILSKNQTVQSFRSAGEDAGGWGATIIELKR